MPESGTYGSVRGAPSNGRPYRDQFELRSNRLACHGQRFALPTARASVHLPHSPPTTTEKGFT